MRWSRFKKDARLASSPPSGRTSFHEARPRKQARPPGDERHIDALSENGQVALRNKAVHGIHYPLRPNLVLEGSHQVVVPDIFGIRTKQRRDGVLFAVDLRKVKIEYGELTYDAAREAP